MLLKISAVVNKIVHRTRSGSNGTIPVAGIELMRSFLMDFFPISTRVVARSWGKSFLSFRDCCLCVAFQFVNTFLHAILNGRKNPTSKGWVRWLQFLGRQTKTMSFSRQTLRPGNLFMWQKWWLKPFCKGLCIHPPMMRSVIPRSRTATPLLTTWFSSRSHFYPLLP